MLYLEDYLEMIEHLPQELRDRFTEMRELDLSVQNSMDSLEKRVKILFTECRRGNGEIPQGADAEFNAIRTDYYRTLEDADEKVQLASQMYDLVEKYLRRLDTELHKFKCELEADNKGITELLEKRSLELDTPGASNPVTPSHQKENSYDFDLKMRSRPRSEKRRDSSASSQSSSHQQLHQEKRQSIALSSATLPHHQAIVESSRNSQASQSQPMAVSGGHTTVHIQHIAQQTVQASAQPNVNVNVNNAIAVAASQAIAATQQMQQGRRTASLKASYEAIGGDFAGAARTALQAIQQEQSSNKKKKKVSSSNSSSSSSLLSSSLGLSTSQPVSPHHQVDTPPPSSSASATAVVQQEAADADWNYDPNEPRYCVCDQISYGDMVACDNEDCPFEWFHYPCVGITAPPKGKWYCPRCTSSMRRRGVRKN